MLHQLEGSHGIAMAVALCRPKVICAYPITPQTHIVEGLGEIVRSGELENCEYINVESETAALSVAIGAQATGVRSYTATSSQGLLHMMEAVYNASGLDLPIVMTLGNRAIGAPINIWNDHTDAMAARDAGWIMLFAETNQEALDLHIQAFKIAEKARCPVMVCVDGFILTHAFDRVDVPSQSEVDDFLPAYEPHISLDITSPLAIGTMVPPEYFMEVRYLAHKKQEDAIGLIECVGNAFHKKFGRDSGGLLRKYGVDSAETVVVTMGSVAGTVKDAVDELNSNGGRYGVLSLISYRPFPGEAIKSALKNAKKVVVLEKALAVGVGGILSKEIELCLGETDTKIVSLIAGLGGRPITKPLLKEYLANCDRKTLDFLGLNMEIIKERYSPVDCCGCSSK